MTTVAPGSGQQKPAPVPDALDLDQATEEVVVGHIFALQRAKSERNALLPELIAQSSNAKRNLDICKAQIKYCTEAISTCQSLLRSLRP